MSAEQEFREAFERLRLRAPRVLPAGSAVTQNNVAREAGKDASALKKQRFPRLINEIQAYVETQAEVRAPSRAQRAEDVRRRNRSLREKMADLKKERDTALSLLVEADTVILHLQLELERLKAKSKERASKL